MLLFLLYYYSISKAYQKIVLYKNRTQVRLNNPFMMMFVNYMSLIIWLYKASFLLQKV